MTTNQATIDRYMEGFRRGDHAAILACLTDDVEWEIPGAFHARGKPAFDAHIEMRAGRIRKLISYLVPLT